MEIPSGADPYKILLIDVSRAHFYADAVRDVFIELPDGDPQKANPDVIGKLEKTKDAFGKNL